MIFIFVEKSINIIQNFKEKGVSRPQRPIPKFALAWSPIISIDRELTETGLQKKQLDGLQLITGGCSRKVSSEASTRQFYLQTFAILLKSSLSKTDVQEICFKIYHPVFWTT